MAPSGHMPSAFRQSQRLRMLSWVELGLGSLGLGRVFQLVANVACCSCWCSFCSAGGRDVMAYHLASLLHAVGAGAALTSSTVAFILSALGRWHLVCLPAVFSLLRASYACYQPAAPHSSSPHVLERIPRRAPLSFRVCFVGSGAKGASADDWRMHARSCRVTPVALHYPGP